MLAPKDRLTPTPSLKLALSDASMFTSPPLMTIVGGTWVPPTPRWSFVAVNFLVPEYAWIILLTYLIGLTRDSGWF